MPTQQQYELGAAILTLRARASDNLVDKMKIMSYLGNIRESQYKATGEERAKKLTRNCRRAEEKLLVRAIRAYGFVEQLIKQHEWYSYRPRMNALKERVANGGKACNHDLNELAKYNAMIEEERFDRSCDI